jgi:hypothetical protein
MVAVTSADNQDSGQSRPVSASEPCLICAHTDWCFQVFDFKGDLSKIICGRAQPGDAPDDWECSGMPKMGGISLLRKGIDVREGRIDSIQS